METEKKNIKRSIFKKNKKKSAAGKNVAVAQLCDVPSSPRKMRLVADLIRGQRVSRALTILKYEPKHPSIKLEKLLLSAVNNWELKNPDLSLENADLYVKQIYVNSGRFLKRLRPAPQGRGHRIRKRSNHVMLTLESMNTGDRETQPMESKEKKVN